MDSKTAAAQELLTWLNKTAQNTEGFVLEQAPLIAQEILSWSSMVNWVLLIILGIIVVISLVTAVAAEDGGLKLLATFVFFMAVGFALMAIMQLVKIEHTPRLYLLDWSLNRIRYIQQ